MCRRLLNVIVLLMLILQGIGQVSAQGVVEHAAEKSVPASSPHCPEHIDQANECSCCDAALMTEAGCASLCSVSAAPPVMSLRFYRPTDRDAAPRVIGALLTIFYLPLTPPPIS
jgi:hypothetical protein